jgi:hypothetical protein
MYVAKTMTRLTFGNSTKHLIKFSEESFIFSPFPNICQWTEQQTKHMQQNTDCAIGENSETGSLSSAHKATDCLDQDFWTCLHATALDVLILHNSLIEKSLQG